MRIFSRIKKAIFGDRPEARREPPAASTRTTAGPGPTPTARGAGAPDLGAGVVNAQWERPVDVEQVLSDLARKNPQKLNWRTSIVDLMKLLEIDSSLENRKELAGELGYTGDMNDSAAMNIWLHKRVMQELEKNGGKVPASLVA